MKIEEFLKKYAQSLVALGIGLIVMWFVLNQLHTKVPGVVGNTAGKIGELATGQAYNF